MLPIQHWMTSTQTRVYFVRTPELPILDLRIIFDAGSARDGQYPGTAELAHELLREGTAILNAEKVAYQFENAGAIFNTSNDHDMAIISLRSLTQENCLTPALETLTSILNAPAFTKQGFKHQQKLLLKFLEHEEQSPSDLADNAFFQALYAGHPYCTPVIGTKKGVHALDADKVAEFYHQYYCAQNASLIIVSDFSRHQAEQVAEQIVQKLPQGALAPPLTEAPKIVAAQTKKLEYDSKQTHVVMGQIGINFSSPDYFPLYLGNYILGGDALISRLGHAVRETKGLVYDIRSYFLPLLYNGPFLISFQSRRKKAPLALETVYETLSNFLAQKPTEAELQAAKDHLTKGYNLHFDSNRAIAGNLVPLAFYQLPLNYFDTFSAKISAVTAEEIHTTFNLTINPHHLIAILVGKGAK